MLVVHASTLNKTYLFIIIAITFHPSYSVSFYFQIFSPETTKPNPTKLSWYSSWMLPFQYCVRQLRSPFKMAAITKKNWDFYNCLLLLYYMLKWAQISTVIAWQWVVKHILPVFLWNFSFSRFILIIQIRYILIKNQI
jgi:hypothetical protein